jgi:hypothetical protein
MRATGARTDALIREIAQLFVKYPSTAWKPLLEQLTQGGDGQVRIASAIQTLLQEAATILPKGSLKRQAVISRVKGKAKAKSAVISTTDNAHTSPLPFSARRYDILTAISHAMADRQLLPTLTAIREVFLVSGGKGELPKTRKAASAMLLRHLDSVPDSVFETALASFKDGSNSASDEEEYARWFKLIKPTP